MGFDLTLTFDNGPDMVTTAMVLDTLAARDIRATFFVVGQKLEANRAVAQRAHEEGHWIGNHTWSHTVLGEMRQPLAASREITETQEAMGHLVHKTRLFRPVGGGGVIGPHLLNREAAELLKRERYTCVLWNSIPRDWIEPEDWVERAMRQVLAQSWTLMVVHDIPTGAMKHLPRFLDLVAEAGGTIRQEFPPDCIPILCGEARQSLQAITNLQDA